MQSRPVTSPYSTKGVICPLRLIFLSSEHLSHQDVLLTMSPRWFMNAEMAEAKELKTLLVKMLIVKMKRILIMKLTEEVINEFNQRGISIDISTHNQILKSLTATNRFEEGYIQFQNMQKENIY